VVTSTVTVVRWPCASETLTWHFPAATETTLKVALGPEALDGEKVAIPLQSELAAPNEK
jgi:hypothetical protein